MRVNDLLALTYVPRWANIPMSRQQSVGEHTFRVMVIFTELCARLSILCDETDLLLVMHHDGPESSSGDIPSPFKAQIAEHVRRAEDVVCQWYDRPSAEVFSKPELYNILKLADVIESYTWLRWWGNGAMAKRVLVFEYKKVDIRISESGVDRTIVMRLIDDILDEEGRYGGRAEASL